MRIIEVDNIEKYVIPSRVIGFGSTAICFLMKDGNVLKYYINTANKMKLFNSKDMLLFFEKVSNLSNETYIAPKEVLFKNSEIIGYTYPYVNAKTLNKCVKKIRIFDILTYYNKLLKDTKEISNHYFRLGDLHDRNILYNDRLRIIDLDQGRFSDYIKSNPYTVNINQLMKAYIYEIFKVKDYQILEFLDLELQDIYHSVRWDNIDSVNNFLESIARKTDLSNPTTVEVRRKIKIRKKINSYYHFFE